MLEEVDDETGIQECLILILSVTIEYHSSRMEASASGTR